jgi:signal transduction histidine kinase
MVVLEIIGNIVVLLPTGDISSPYIWYSLNVVIVSAYFLSPLFLLSCVLAYILAFGAYYWIHSADMQLYDFLLQNSSLILSYFIIVIAAYLLVCMDKRIREERTKTEKVNAELYKANKMLMDSMDEIALLYNNVNAFINLRNKKQLSGLITEYTLRITKALFAFVYDKANDEINFASDGDLSEEEQQVLSSAVKNRLSGDKAGMFDSDMPVRDIICGRELIICAIKTSNNAYGILGIQINGGSGEIIEYQIIDQVRMLASLSAILFESFQYEVLYSDYLVSEEQHRIANEIHDGVSQRLFYISCKISDILMKTNQSIQVDWQAELRKVQNALKTAIKELRDTIYSNGARTYQNGVFEESVRNYLNDIMELNDVKITLHMQGRFENISSELIKVIFRIIGEGCGNAIRHGESKNIGIKLCEDKENICIEITDDGTGFDICEVTKDHRLGMGMRNMNCLVRSYYGSIDIDSQPYKGTKISVSIPLCYLEKGEMLC